MNEKPSAKGESRGGNPIADHPVGTAVGGVTGAAATGAAEGSAAGPVGPVLGAAVGAAAGGVPAAMVADMIDPAHEENYWRQNFKDRDYAAGDFESDWSPAYRYGVEAFRREPGRHFDEMEAELSAGWTAARGESTLDWDRARLASLDAWQRARDLAERAVPGDADEDGR